MAEETNHKPYRLGLALSGGGAKGFAHIGVFRMMEECALRPDIIVGTSAGALMGTLFADGYSAAEIQELFTGREFSEFAQLQIPKAGLFDSKRFRYFLRRHLRTKNIEDLQIPMVIVATDLDNGEVNEFRSAAGGGDARPRHREAIGFQVHRLQQFDVFPPAVIAVAGGITGLTPIGAARCVGENIPDAPAFSILDGTALDLIGCSRSAPYKFFWKYCHVRSPFISSDTCVQELEILTDYSILFCVCRCK